MAGVFLASLILVASIHPRGFDVRPGMTATQVETCVGRPADCLRHLNNECYEAQWNYELLVVVFGENGRVDYVRFNSPRQAAFFDRVRMWVAYHLGRL